MRKTFILCFPFLCLPLFVFAEDRRRLWLKYEAITDLSLLKEYRKNITGWMIERSSSDLSVAKEELRQCLNALLFKTF